MTQTEVLLRYLRSNPGASSLEITLACGIVNTTGRISDLRAMPGVNVDCRRRSDGHQGYWLTEGDSGPGIAHIRADDSPQQVDRKMAEAMAPIKAAREAWDRVFGGEA